MENANLKKKLLEQLKQLGEESSLYDIQKTISKFYTANSGSDKLKAWKSPIGRKIFILSVIAAILSLILISTLSRYDYLVLGIYAAWTILPPCWFLYEYVWVFPDELKFDSDQFNDLKYVQEIAAKIWAGLIVVMTAYLVHFKSIKL